FFSLIFPGSVCNSYSGAVYKLTVLYTMFVRRRHRGIDSGLIILEDFVNSFAEDHLGLRYPLSPFAYTGRLFNLLFFCVSSVCSACKQFLEKYAEYRNRLWQVEGPGHWCQITSIMHLLRRRERELAGEASEKGNKNSQAEGSSSQTASVSEASGQTTELETQQSVEFLAVTTAVQTRSSQVKRPRIGKTRLESEPGTSQGVVEKTHVSESRMYFKTCCRSELPARTSERSEVLNVSEDNTVEKDEEGIVENENQSASEVDPRVSHPEKQTEREEIPLEPLNGEVTEEVDKTSLMAEEEMANEVLSDEFKLQSETRGEEPLTLIVPLIVEAPEKPSGDTVTEEVRELKQNDSELLTEENTLVQEGTEEQQEPENSTTEIVAASASKDEPSDNGLPNAVVAEAEEPVFEDVSPKTASSLEEQNEEARHNSQEAPAALSQGSLIVVELEGVSLQQPSGQEGQKNQLEEHSEESAEQMDHYMQAAAERAADSSSEEAEIEVPIVDRRNLRRKAKGYKGPPRKKGKSV
ncbi:F169A protein, partial [Atlantisia rogersi]|nr:F169A protein [Atlantisia rogersi]